MLGTAQPTASMADFKGWTSNYYNMGTAYKSIQIHLLRLVKKRKMKKNVMHSGLTPCTELVTAFHMITSFKYKYYIN